MTEEVSEEVKKEVFRLISIPGIDIDDIVKQLNLDYDKVMKIIENEYLRANLDQGRSLCCRF